MCRISSRSPRVIEPAFDPRNHGTGARPRCFCLKCAVRLSCVARTHVMPGSFVSCPYFINTHRRCFPVQLWRKVARTVYWAGFLIKKCIGRLPAGWCQCIEDSIAFVFAGCWEIFQTRKKVATTALKTQRLLMRTVLSFRWFWLRKWLSYLSCR